MLFPLSAQIYMNGAARGAQICDLGNTLMVVMTFSWLPCSPDTEMHTCLAIHRLPDPVGMQSFKHVLLNVTVAMELFQCCYVTMSRLS